MSDNRGFAFPFDAMIVVVLSVPVMILRRTPPSVLEISGLFS
jgi:hypothetical protein